MPAIVLKNIKKKNFVWSYLFSLVKEPQLNWLPKSFGKRTTTKDRFRKNFQVQIEGSNGLDPQLYFYGDELFFQPVEKWAKPKKKKKIQDLINFVRHYYQNKAKNNKE